jgi:hypothetical protein
VPTDCYGCSYSLAGNGSAGSRAGTVLGVCKECGLLGCPEHAERDQASGWWVCSQSVVKALSVGAGIDDEDTPELAVLAVRSVDELEARFPLIARAIETHGSGDVVAVAIEMARYLGKGRPDMPPVAPPKLRRLL